MSEPIVVVLFICPLLLGQLGAVKVDLIPTHVIWTRKCICLGQVIEAPGKSTGDVLLECIESSLHIDASTEDWFAALARWPISCCAPITARGITSGVIALDAIWLQYYA